MTTLKMKEKNMHRHKITLIVSLLSLPLSGYLETERARAAADDQSAPYQLAQTFKIGGAGGWDYLTVDPDQKRLYVPRSTHTMVLDEATGNPIADIPGQQRNHGVAIVPELSRGFITDGKAADVTIFDTKTFVVLGKIKAADDADGVIYDPATKKILISCGDANQLITISADVDPKSGKADAPIDLGGKPEFLAADNAGKAYVNLEDKDEVAVVDIKEGKVLNRWPVAPGGAPVGMSIDREHHRLFVGCRKPQKLIVMNSDDGKVVADLPIGAGVDATQFDDGFAFASCRDGTLAIAHANPDGKFEIVQTVKTPAGARTMGLDSSTHAIYLPTAEFMPSTAPQGRPTPKPDSFMVAVVHRKQ
jgi:hypothetical protein